MEKCSHDNCWVLEEIQGIPQSCFACAIEVLESSEKPNVNKVHIIKEILRNLTNPSSCAVIFQQNGIAVKHLSEILVSSAYQIGDSEIISIIDDIFLIILRCLGDEVGTFISSLIISKCYHVAGYNFLQPLLRLLSGLLKNCESACDSVLLKDDVFPRYLSSTIEYPDNILKQTILQLFFLGINLRMQNAQRLSTPVFIKDLYPELPVQILSIISTNDQSSTLLSCVDIITSTSVAQDFLSWICSSASSDHDATVEMENTVLSLLTGLKRILLKRDSQLTLKVVHCLMGLLGRHPDSILHSLLNADLAEFLYDILRSTTSPDLISSIYCCILLLAESQAFYTNCHATYGFESILRSLQTILPMSHSTLCAQGILLLSTILKQQSESSSVSILCTLSLLDRTIEIIKDGLESKHPDVIIAACTATKTLISHFPGDLPVIEVMKLVEHMSDKLTSYISLLNGKNNADIGGADGDIDLCEIGPTSTEDNANIRKSTIRKLYTDVWNILRSSVDLALKFLPNLSDFAESNDDSFVADAHKLADTLLDKITNHWISSTTKTLDALTSPSLIQAMLSTLSTVCQHSESRTFLQKLMRGILIRLALKVKSKFHDDPRHSDLIKVCVDFLTELTYAGIRAALGSDFSNQLISYLNTGFAELQGKVSSYLKVLEEICSLAHRDDSILSMQCTVVSLLFNSFWYSRGDMITISELSSALETYFILNGSFTYLPRVILQQLLFLHAVCYADLTVTPTLHLSFITAANECNVAYIRHPVFISYVLRLPSTEQQVIQIQERALKRWINETMEHTDEEKLLIEICKRHENAGKVLMRSLLTSENETKLTEILLKVVCSNYVHHAKQQQEEAASFFCEEVARNLAEYAYNILARSTVEPSILHTLLHLLMLVTQQSHDSQSVEIHSFLLRVLKLLLDSLSKNKNLDRTTVASSMQLIKVILISSTPYKQRSTSVLAVIFAHKQFLESLYHWNFEECTDNYELVTELCINCSVATLDVLRYLYQMQSEHKTKVSYSFQVTSEALLSFVTASDENIRTAGLNMWTALFENDFNCKFFKLTELDNDPTSTSYIGPIGLKTIRKLWMETLNFTSSQDISEKTTAFRCSNAICQYVYRMHENHDLLIYLLKHPWLNIILLQGLKEITERNDMADLTTWMTICMELTSFRDGLLNKNTGLESDSMPSHDGALDFEELILSV